MDCAPKLRHGTLKNQGQLDSVIIGSLFGSKDFVTGLEAKREQVLEPRKRGRKPKHSDQGTEADCASASGLAASAE